MSLRFKTFVINLDKSTTRLSNMTAQLDDFGITFERIPAVNGKELSSEEIFKYYSPDLNKKRYFAPLSLGEIGCYMSNIKACEKLISENLDYAIILEDDLVLKPMFKLLPHILNSIDISWNYIKLICPGRKKVIKKRTQLLAHYPANFNFEMWQKNFKIKSEQKSIDWPLAFDLISWYKPPIGNLAYAITQKGAEEFLNKHSVFFRPIDVDLQYWWESELNVMGLSPEFLSLAECESTIGHEKQKYHHPFARLMHKLEYAINSRLCDKQA